FSFFRFLLFFFSSRRRHTRFSRDWSSDVCSSDLCWPWFGALARNPQEVRAHYRGGDAPAHGLVRTRDWRLEDVREEGDAVSIEFVLDSREQPLSDWPEAAALRLPVRLDQRLHLQLT